MRAPGSMLNCLLSCQMTLFCDIIQMNDTTIWKIKASLRLFYNLWPFSKAVVTLHFHMYFKMITFQSIVNCAAGSISYFVRERAGPVLVFVGPGAKYEGPPSLFLFCILFLENIFITNFIKYIYA